MLAERLLAPVRDHGVDTLLLGCTHYPYLARTISDVMGREVVLVSSADETAFAVAARPGRAGPGPGGPGPRGRPPLRLLGRRGSLRPARPAPARPRAGRRRGGGMGLSVTDPGVLGDLRRRRTTPAAATCCAPTPRPSCSTSGPGALAKAQRHIDLVDVDAIVLTHEHPDHWTDLPVARNAYRYVFDRVHLPVYATAGTIRPGGALLRRGDLRLDDPHRGQPGRRSATSTCASAAPTTPSRRSRSWPSHGAALDPLLGRHRARTGRRRPSASAPTSP